MHKDTARSLSAWDRARSEGTRIKLEAILHEADLLFSRKGYNSTSLDDIAGRLRITKTALYHYVRNKSELLHLCYQRSVELTEQCYEKADAQGRTGLEKVLAYLRIDAGTGVMSMTPLTEIEVIRDPKARHALSQRTAACEARFRDFISRGIRDGSIRDCDPHLTSLFILGASRNMMQWYDPDASDDLPGIVERFIEFCCQGMAAPAAIAQEQPNRPSF